MEPTAPSCSGATDARAWQGELRPSRLRRNGLQLAAATCALLALALVAAAPGRVAPGLAAAWALAGCWAAWRASRDPLPRGHLQVDARRRLQLSWHPDGASDARPMQVRRVCAERVDLRAAGSGGDLTIWHDSLPRPLLRRLRAVGRWSGTRRPFASGPD